jgi:hypothetical protein
LGLLLLIWLLVLGFVIGLSDHKKILSSIARLFLAVGFCGGFSRSHMSINSASFQLEFRKNAVSKPSIFTTLTLLITTQKKMDYPKWSICDTNSGHSLAELDNTGNPVETSAKLGASGKIQLKSSK